MKYFLPMLAQESGTNIPNEFGTQAIFVGVFGLLIIVLLVWAAFLRRSKKKRKRISRPHHWQVEPGDEKSGQKGRRSRRERRRRSEGDTTHRPLNPTLASKGGLPPRRPDDVPPAGD